MGVLWMLTAPMVIYFLVMGAIHNINSNGIKDINMPVPWIIIGIFTPIALRLFILGYYAFKGKYNKLPASPDEI